MNEENKTKTKKPTVKKTKAVADTPVAKRRIIITFKADPGATVCIAGSFNDWNPSEKKLIDKLGNGVYSATITLAPGIYEYKFIVNGIWTLDPDPDRDWTQNGLGTLNSVLRV